MEQKLTYIDALRGIAVLCVVATHVGLNSLTGIAHKFTDLGAKGVELFYFVSAFTLFLSVQNRRTNDKSPHFDFAIRRIFRIAPLYFIAILYYAILMPMYNVESICWLSILTNLIFIHGLFPTYINTVVPGGWSIGVEMMFYTLVPFLAARIGSLKQAVVFLIISVLVGFFFRILLANNPLNFDPELWKNYLYWYLPSQLSVFGCGILFYFIMRDSIAMLLQKRFMILLFLLLMISIVDRLVLRSGIIDVNLGLGFVFLLLAYGMSRYKILILNNRFTRLLGRLSFSIYLTHFAVIFWLQHYAIIDVEQPNGVVNFLFAYSIVLSTSVVISYITYSLIELRGQELGRRMITRIDNWGL